MAACPPHLWMPFALVALSACGDGGGGAREPERGAALESPDLAWLGDWRADASYPTDSVVAHDGSAWLATGDDARGMPGTDEGWRLLAERGAPGERGPRGQPGPAGPSGPAGADGVPGSVGLDWRGVWEPGSAYPAGSAVSHLGQSWFASVEVGAGLAPDPDGPWELLAARGEEGPEGGGGAPGVPGSPGPRGDRGPAGAQGPTGPQGIPGPRGERGPTGPAGATGSAGPAGETGRPGGDGATGPAGVQGPAGPAGPDGAIGIRWRHEYAPGTAYFERDAIAYEGSAWIAVDDQVPGETPGEAAVWELLVSAGERGPAGEPGPSGPQGPRGPSGTEGRDGVSGSPGVAGPAGAVGPVGPSGPAGPAGADGAGLPPGMDVGDVLYWNGSEWVLTLPPGPTLSPPVLTLVDGVPTWVGSLYELGGTGPAGGLVIDVSPDGLHGIEAARTIAGRAPWGCPNQIVDGVSDTSVGAGAANTALIVGQCGTTTAAGLADAFRSGGFSDWYLPSAQEFSLFRIAVGLQTQTSYDSVLWWTSNSTGGSFGATNGYLSSSTFGNANSRTSSMAALPIRSF